MGTVNSSPSVSCSLFKGEPAGSEVHPLHGVSRTDGADPEGDCSFPSSTQRGLYLLLPHWFGHLHSARRYSTTPISLQFLYMCNPLLLFLGQSLHTYYLSIRPDRNEDFLSLKSRKNGILPFWLLINRVNFFYKCFSCVIFDVV